MARKNKEEVIKTPRKNVKGIPVEGLWGLALGIVCISIGYANYRVFFGAEDMIARIMLIPSSLAVLGFLGYKSWK